MRKIGWGLAAALLLASAARGQAPPPARPVTPTPVDAMATTRNQVVVDGKPLRYTTRSGLIPIHDNDTGQLMARMFVMAYVADRAPGAPPRPLTFVWNGGPGASSSQVHLVGFGPKGYRTPATYPDWIAAPPREIADRPETWLAASDLVFVDPIGTGYSRATSEAFRDLLYSQRGDAEAVAEMIRVYRTRYDAFDQPLFLAGESYGTTRAVEVADALEKRRTHVAGVILISGGLGLDGAVPPALGSALQVSGFAATGHFHRRLAPDLQALSRDEAVRRATDWARGVYAPALEKRDSLAPAEREAVLAGLKRFTGIEPRFVDAKTLTIGKDAYLDHLLEDRNLELGRYDSRMAFPQRPTGLDNWTPTGDPSIRPMLDLMQGTNVAATRYIRDTLGYRSDLLYRGPFGEAFHPRPLTEVAPGIFSDWMAIMWARPPAAGAAAAPRPLPPLVRAMRANPAMRIFSVVGLYDGDCAAREEAVARASADLRPRVRLGCYAAGHMLYSDVVERRKLAADFRAFVKGP